MKKTNLKNRVLMIIVVPFLCLAIFGSCLLLERKAEKLNYQKSYAASNSATSYVDSNSYMNELNETTMILDRAYSLDEEYPIFGENQTTSNLCWIYSSFKVLETSLMKQRNEYHNFSEVGTAFLYYLNYISQDPNYNFESDSTFIDKSGDFVDFNMIIQNSGIVYENSFSNDLFYDLSKDNYENYKYILDDVDTTFMDNVKPINIHSSSVYTSANQTNKIKLLQKYIVTYGGFCVGLEKGVISSTNYTYFRTDDKPENEDDGHIKTPHAVCVVGWDQNKQAFLALNSWGVEYGKYNYFWIPYSYDFIYGTTYGYICENNNDDIGFHSSTAGGTDGYSAKFMDLSNEIMNNMFVYGEDFSVSYKLNDRFDFNKIIVNIYKNQALVNSEFNINFNDNDSVVEITIDDITKLSSGYYIEFYYDKEYLGTRDFYVFTGVEVCYIDFKNSDPTIKPETALIETVTLFNNVLATGKYSEFYYHNEVEDDGYHLNFLFPFDYNGGEGVQDDKVTISVGNIYATSTDKDGNTSTVYVPNNTDKIEVNLLSSQPLKKNLRTIEIKNMFNNFHNKFVEININVTSNVTGKTQVYTFSFFISEKVNMKTYLTNKIVYEVYDGVNSDKNITRYPKYDYDGNMTSFTLVDPVKHGSVFRGWYLDKNFTKRIYKIDSSIPELLEKIRNPVDGKDYSDLLGKIYSDDIVIYAWWESEEAEYFDMSLSLSEITDYYGDKKDVSSDIIYGDSVTSSFVFSPIPEDLKTYSYSAKATYYLNGQLVENMKDVLLNDYEPLLIENKFLTDDGKIAFVCGDYNIRIHIVLVVSHQFVIEDDIEIDYSIGKKVVTANFDKETLKCEYDGYYHIPSIESFSGKYAEDADFEYTFNNTKKFEVGSYAYTVDSINNDNYQIAENQTDYLVISQKSIEIIWKNLEKVYNGSYQNPDYELVGVVDSDRSNTHLSLGFKNNVIATPQMKNVGEYNIAVRSISNKNYKIEGNDTCLFKITKAPLVVRFDNKSVRFTISPSIREGIEDYRVTWTVEGELYDDVEELNISYVSKGPNALESGDYPIVGSYKNDNYDVQIVDGVYTVLGHYYVYYTLPDGTEYEEIVNAGENPKGVKDIDKSIFKAPFMSRIVYDKELVGNGRTDIYISVKVVSYAWVLYFSIAILGFVLAYFIVSRKEKRNRYR